MIKVCLHCSKEFEAKDDRYHMCSIECKQRALRANKERMVTKRLAASVCVRCKAPTRHKHCESCLAKQASNQRQLRADRAANGICSYCGKAAEVSGNAKFKRPELKQLAYCVLCYMKDYADRHMGSRRFGSQLQAIWHKQNGRCAYTDMPLVLGVSASLDHIIPSAKGGLDHIYQPMSQSSISRKYALW